MRALWLAVMLMVMASQSLIITPAQADELHLLDRFGLSLGGSYGAGTMENSGMGLPSRTMTSGSVEALLSYQVLKNWQVGVDFDYSIVQQLTSFADSGGTNLRGKAWMIGIGTRYFFTEQLAIQGAIDFVGRHRFDHPTGSGQPDHLSSPLAFRAKLQWFAFTALPGLSLDADVRYQRWSTFDVQGTEHSQTTTQAFGGLGLTYHFGRP